MGLLERLLLGDCKDDGVATPDSCCWDGCSRVLVRGVVYQSFRLLRQVVPIQVHLGSQCAAVRTYRTQSLEDDDVGLWRLNSLEIVEWNQDL